MKIGRHIASALITLLFVSPGVFAEQEESERLGRVVSDLAACVNTVAGNFSSTAMSEAAGKSLISQMVLKIKKIVEIESVAGMSKSSSLLFEAMGKEVFSGFLLGNFLEDEALLRERAALIEKYGERGPLRANQELWDKYGCDAIYSSLSVQDD